ncbi:MAG: RHS repeat-associated core domain-containing protein [Scytonema sp. PMC 1069.18]|nr:RHS repeat-associated core domain-containing protein [Scytonema sp. PMC 1069.18]MEC4883409.1 RHS repeat-associated core domain-containing protein [Scytonema sp. PMC 1070.18]
MLGRRIAQIDQAGQTTRYSYDALGRLLETIYADATPLDPTDNPRVKTQYDKAGRIVASIDEKGNRTEYEYDKAGRRILVRNALGHETTYSYDSMGNQLTETDALGRTTKYVYDSAGHKLQTDFANGTYTQTSYNAVGLKVSETNQAGQTTHFAYDALDRLIEVILPDDTPNDLSNNPRTKKEYNELGQVVAQIDELGNREEFEYDAAGRLIESRSDCRCRRKSYTYDAANNKITETDELGRTTRFIYDEQNRLIETRFHDGSYKTTTYNDLGQIIAETDQSGKTNQFEYDARGRLTAVIDALQQRTEYSYDLTGNLIQIKDANKHITQHEYDALNHRNATVLTMGQRSITTYDAVGNIVSTTDFNGDTITYRYDALNRISEKLFPNSTKFEYTYTPTGQLQSVKDQWGTTTSKYDVRDRLIEKVDPDGKFIRYTYDAASNRTGVTTSTGTTTYTYDRYKQLKTVTDPQGGLTTYTYDKAGNLIRTELANDTVETRSYDDLNRLVYLENKKTGGDIISSYRYTLDASGNRLAVEENNGQLVNYTYDDLYRLTQEKITDSVAGNRIINYAFDAVGNRLTRNDSVQGLTSYTYDNNDRLLTESINGQTTSYTYDNNGNTLTITNPNSQTVYDWDYENRLIEADITNANGATETKYRYNTDGVRVSSITNGQETRYLIDALQPYAQVIEEYSPNGTVQAGYVYGLDLISQTRAGVQSNYHVDGLGSTRVLTNASGNVTDTYTYDAYGNLIGSTGNTVNSSLYTGEQYDSNLGEYYLRARYYDPGVGRFTARDPFEGFIIDPLSLAKYPYVHGNPVNMIDPSGLFGLGDAAAIGTILGILIGISLYVGLARPIGSVQQFDTDDVVVPGYLKNTNPVHTGINDFLTTVITSSQYQTVRRQVQNCNGLLGTGNCNFTGFPMIVWGFGDLPEIAEHTQDAIAQTRQSFLARIKPTWVEWRGLLNPIGSGKPHQWYNAVPGDCQWIPGIGNPRYRGRDCDEYPYNSTLQGGPLNHAANSNSVSLRLVDQNQNRLAGTFLGGSPGLGGFTQGFYQLAAVPPNHPLKSWFGVGITAGRTAWVDRNGTPRDFTGGEIPF